MQAFAYSGAGNQFLFFDDRQERFLPTQRPHIPRLCADRFDGLVLLQNSSCADFRMRIFNRDASEASMCGNALRCSLSFAVDQGLVNAKSCRIQTNDGVKFCRFEGALVAASMGNYQNFQTHNLQSSAIEQELYSLHMGVAHLVVFNDGSLSIDQIGPYLRHHPLFSPEGVNVNLVQEQDGQFFVQTFEKGVEKMTASCGTGACATAIALHIVKKIPQPISLQTPSKKNLQVTWEEGFKEIYLLGPVERIAP